jgi:hypothetical protein
MRYLPIAAALLLTCLSGFSQQVVDVNSIDFDAINHNDAVNNAFGQIYQGTKYVKVTSGSPFFKQEWMKAKLIDGSGASYASNAVKLNLIDNEINFLDNAGTERVSTVPVKQMTLFDSTTGDKYIFILGEKVPAAEKSLAKTWFQVVVNDKVSLCLQIVKKIHEGITYGSATTEEDIVTLDFYYVQMKGNFIRVKTWSDLVQLFNDRKDSIDQYIHAHHLKGKPEDYAPLVQYYNSISKA